MSDDARLEEFPGEYTFKIFGRRHLAHLAPAAVQAVVIDPIVGAGMLGLAHWTTAMVATQRRLGASDFPIGHREP